MGITFPGSPEPTIGVEIELQTVEPETLDLASGAPALLNRFREDPHVKKELLQCCLELDTRVCRTVGEVEADLRERVSSIIRAADEMGYRLIAAGTHPFGHWTDQEVTPDARYHTQLQRTQWTARRMLTFGLHIHIGVDTAEKAMSIFNVFPAYIPLLLALSASSPFWEGMDTGLVSARSKVFESLPGGGVPYQMRNWTEFQRMIRILQQIGTIESIQELWGDVRPHSQYGTLELRVCDAMPRLDELLAVVAFAQALVVWLGDLYERGVPQPVPRHWIVQENKWRAVRWGMDCRLVTDESGGQQRFRTVLEEMLESLAPVSEALGSWPYLKTIERMLETGSSADRQRRVFRETNSLEAVVMSLEQELRSSCAGERALATEAASHEDEGITRFRKPLKDGGPVWRDF